MILRYNEIMSRRFLLYVFLGFVLAGCTGISETAAETPSVLTPYVTRTAGIPTLPPAAPTLEPPPASELPTQITHVVQKGEDMGGIATKYGVKIKDLKAANAKIDPRMIPVGTVLIIPSGNPEQDVNQPTSVPAPAVILQTGIPVCYADPSGGAWCLMNIDNTSGATVEDISADFVLSGSDGTDPQISAAFGLLDHLTAGSSMPLAVYFPDAPDQPWQINTRLRTASTAINESERYLQSSLEKSSIELSTDKLSAHVNGQIQLQANQADANVILVMASAYNAAGQPVGVRRWESSVGLESGSGLMYDFTIYSLGGPIDRVDVLAETRPK
jgi:LysM repeat protein